MEWYFDFISPYAYLQSTRLPEFEASEPVRCVPVLFAGLLNHWGNIGPAELAPKRQWTFEHVSWLADHHGIALKLPPQHPFNPLPLLRLAIAADPTVENVQRIFNFVWAEGNSPDDAAAFAKLCAQFDLEPGALKREDVKNTLRSNTESAAERGVFGVPTVARAEKKFWGFDATDMALAHAAAGDDESKFPFAAMDVANAMPDGVARKRPVAVTPPPAPTSHEPRIPYVPIDLKEPADIVDAVRKRRGGELIKLDRMLLHSPELAKGWNSMLGAVRTKLSLDPKLREMAMCTVAVINNAEYEFSQHAPIYMECGATQAQADALRAPDAALADKSLFNDTERAALGLCIDMTRTVQVHDKYFEQCRQLLGEQQVVEFVATVAAYNMVSRFLVATNIHPD
jgi:2-hydroxychromene-2-carboxylate isomerase/alkylhydroperoxidase family enzyme